MSLTKIVFHWTAGTGIPNAIERKHYHFLVDSKGDVHTGKFKPEDNINCFDGKCAEHTGGGNTGAIGLALCGMLGFDEVAKKTRYPLKEAQFEAACYKAASLCKLYGIPVTPMTVFTHYEFGQAHPKTTSRDKIDIVYLPFKPDLPKDLIGREIRKKVKWYLEKL